MPNETQSDIALGLDSTYNADSESLENLSMKKISLICSIAACTVAFLISNHSFAQDEGWGNLTGRIIVKGEVPEPEALTVDKDAAVCLADEDEILDSSLIVSENGALKDAYVMMYFGRGDDKPKVHPSYEDSAEAKVVIDNKKCRFVPNALFLRTSQTLVMKNSDEVGHNCHVTLFNPENEHNANIPAFDEVEVQCPQPEKTPGPVKCDIHKWMKATMLVRDEPYAAITDAEGQFKIENLPAGKWKFQFWHVRAGYMKDLETDSDIEIDQGRRGEFEIEIKSGETVDLGTITYSVEGFKN